MGIRNIFRNLIKSKRSGVANPAQWLIDWVHAGTESSAGVNVSQESALKYTPFWAATRIISGTIASLPFLVYSRNEKDGSKKRVNNHPIYRLIHDRPNEFMDAQTFIETRQAHVLTYGNGFAEIQRDGSGKPIALWPLLPDRIERKIVNDIGYYEIRLPVGGTVNLPDRNVLHIKGLGFDGYTGYDVISYHKEAIGYGVAVKEYGARFFSGGCNTGGIYEHPEALSEKARKNLRASLELEHGGLSKAHRIMILEEGLKWIKTGIDPEQAQALEVQKYTVDDCSRIFNIPPHKLGSLERATFCLPSDTEIYTKNGNKSIAEIEVGEDVWSLDKNDKWILSPVLRSQCTGEDEILNIRTTNRAIRANARHKILIRRKYRNPKPGKGGWQYNEWRNEYVPAGQLKVGDVFVASDRLPDYGCCGIGNRVFTEEFMEFCGLLLGDGNVYDNSVSIARSNNALYMNYYRKAIKNCFVSYDGGNGRNSNIGVMKKPVHIFEGDRQTRFSSVLASKELKELGLSGTARTKSVPGWVFRTDSNMRLAFLRGFLDADGSVDKKGRISYSSCNEKMLSQIRHLSIGCGIPVTNMRCQEGITTLPNSEKKAFKQYSFTCSNPADNKKISSNDPRYIERFANGKPFNKKDRAYPWFGGRGFNIEGASLSKIVSIEKEPAEKVYDLEVAGTHSFIANGVVVHNSNIEEQNIDFLTTTMLYWFKKWEQECNYKLFMPSEQGKMFCEILVEGLLRGKTLERYQAYNIGRNGGWLCVDDIREKENMNPLPDDKGQIFLEPLNMKPAGTVTPEPVDNIRKAHRDMITSQWGRIITKQNKANITNGDFWPGHRKWASNVLFDSVYSWAALNGISAEKTRDELDNMIEVNLQEDIKFEVSEAENLADLTIKRIGDNHAISIRT